MRSLLTAVVLLTLTACTGLPERVSPVTGFQLDRYLGTWYEVARLDHRFERGMTNVTATYALRDDGGVSVRNRGFSTLDNEWKEAEGRAYFVGSPTEGHLKVSFFGPFYGSYAVFGLDQREYSYAFISGNSTDSLWLLARTPQISDEVKQRFIADAKARGFAIDQLIWVTHEQSPGQASQP